MIIPFNVFESIDIRIGTIVQAEIFPEAKKPAYKLSIDFGESLGIKRSSAQITTHYSPQSLIGKQVLAVVNLGSRQIGPFISEVLTLGVHDEQGVILLTPDKKAPNGARMF
ncbi:tRNA-binding protein [Candidatus Dependentiae bacterium]|nr:tRNA-binding protein [Candidatus Dependentiae bacterium]